LSAGQICPPYARDRRTTSMNADAIGPTVQRPTMKYLVATQTRGATGSARRCNRVRALVSQRTGISNQIRVLHAGTRDSAVHPGYCELSCARNCPPSLATTPPMPSRQIVMVAVIEVCRPWRPSGSAHRWLFVAYTQALARSDHACSRLMTVACRIVVKGHAMHEASISERTSVAAIGSLETYLQGPRLLALSETSQLVLVRQISTETAHTILGRNLDGACNRYLRVCLTCGRGQHVLC